MMWAIFHRLVIALTLLAFLGGMTLQLMPPQAAIAATAMPTSADCPHGATPPDRAGTTQKMPCKGGDLPECIKQMGCLGTPSLPLRLVGDVVPYAYAKVAYSTPAVLRGGRSIKPDLLPPIGL